MNKVTPNFAEIRALIDSLPASVAAAPSIDGWLAAARRDNAATGHARLSLFAAAHGLAGEIPGGSVAAVKNLIDAWLAGGGALGAEIEALDCDLRLYDLGADRPTADSRLGDAMTEAEACLAASYGMMAVEPGLDLLVLAALGAGAARAGRAVMETLPGQDPLATLAAAGGPDIAAMLGAILAARLAGLPVILDGDAAEAASRIVAAMRPDAVDHCRLAPQLVADAEPATSEPPAMGVRALRALKR
jgi:nicotinate-nucleotide--dimethylbenzimidazole phosphoribosyltransferase